MVGSDRVTTLMLFKILFLCLQHFLKVILKQCVSIHDKGKFARKKCLNIMCPLTCDVFHVYIYMAAEWEGNWGKEIQTNDFRFMRHGRLNYPL